MICLVRSVAALLLLIQLTRSYRYPFSPSEKVRFLEELNGIKRSKLEGNSYGLCWGDEEHEIASKFANTCGMHNGKRLGQHVILSESSTDLSLNSCEMLNAIMSPSSVNSGSLKNCKTFEMCKIRDMLADPNAFKIGCTRAVCVDSKGQRLLNLYCAMKLNENGKRDSCHRCLGKETDCTDTLCYDESCKSSMLATPNRNPKIKTNLTTNEIETLMDLVNDERRAQPAADMHGMCWGEEEIRVAKKAAGTCGWYYGTTMESRQLFTQLTTDLTASITSLFHKIVSTKDANLAPLSECQEDFECMSYKALVNATAYKIGCVRTVCENVEGEKEQRLYCSVKNHEIPGRSVEPLEKGKACSKCLNTKGVCVDKLCFDNSCKYHEVVPKNETYFINHLSTNEKFEFMKNINGERKKLKSSNMFGMCWRENAVRVAEQFARHCGLYFGTKTDEYQIVTVRTPKLTGEARSLFHKFIEIKNRHEVSWATCDENYECMAYKAMINAHAYEIGCIKQLCMPDEEKELRFYCAIKSPHLAVRGKKPYKSGTPCQDCKNENNTCVDGLCYDAFCKASEIVLSETVQHQPRFTRQERMKFMELVNSLRKAQKAVNMYGMCWREEQVKIAQKHAATCGIMNGTLDGKHQIITVRTKDLSSSPTKLFEKLLSLRNDGDPTMESCGDNDECINYKAMVNMEAYKLGCVKKFCKENGYTELRMYCAIQVLYGVKGGVPAFEIGTPCKQCAMTCSQGLCYDNECTPDEVVLTKEQTVCEEKKTVFKLMQGTVNLIDNNIFV